MDKKESHLKEGRMFCKLLDGDTPVLQNPLISINVADPWCIADSVHVSRVVYPEGLSFVILQFSHIFSVNEETILALFHLYFDRFACSVVHQG